MKNWEVLSSETVLANKWLRVRKDRCRTATGVVIDDYYVVERFDFVMMFPLTRDGRVVLVRQYKHGAGTVLHELPAGYVEEGEELLDAAKRELKEETGFKAGRVLHVATLFPSPALLTNRAHIYFCDELEPAGGQSLDEGENIEVDLVELAALREGVRQNNFVLDCASLAAAFTVIERLDAGDLA